MYRPRRFSMSEYVLFDYAGLPGEMFNAQTPTKAWLDRLEDYDPTGKKLKGLFFPK